MMSEKLDWLQQLGDAFLDDQGAVLDAVQRLRKRAEGTGNLKTSPQMKVSNVSRPGPTGQPAEYIVVEPADPQVMYVPVYDPGVVYGAWPYPDYPPYYYEPPGWIPGTYAYGALAFGASVAVGAAIWGGANWWNRSVNVNVNRYNSFNRTNIAGGNWNHNVNHRGNVPYRNNATAQKFGGQSGANRARAGQGGQGLGQGAGKGQGLGQGAGKGQGHRPGRRQRPRHTAKGAAGRQAMARAVQARAAGASGKGRQGGGTTALAAWRGQEWRQAAGAARSGNLGRWRRRNENGRRRACAPPWAAVAAACAWAVVAAACAWLRWRRWRARWWRRSRRRTPLRHQRSSTTSLLLGRLDNGLGFYRFSYNGSDKAYVGVMAQEVQVVQPDAVSRDDDGILRVYYDRLGVHFQTYDQWLGSGARVPVRVQAH